MRFSSFATPSSRGLAPEAITRVLARKLPLVVSIFFTLVFLLVRKITHNGLGFGDVKLIFITSFCFGLVKSYIALILACLFGIVFIVVKNKISQEKINKVPFAPFISSGYFLVQLFYGLVK